MVVTGSTSSAFRSPSAATVPRTITTPGAAASAASSAGLSSASSTTTTAAESTCRMAAVPDQGRLDPIAPVHPAVVHPAVVADEVPVDVEVGPRADANHHVVAGVDVDVAALGAARTDAGGLVEIPGARLVEEVLGEQRPDRAEIHDVAGPGVVELLLLGDADVCPVAALA